MIERVRIVVPFAWAGVGTKNLGAAYDMAMQEVAEVDESGWVLMMDYDAMLLTSRVHGQLVDYARWAESNNYGLLGVVTNRIGNRAQIYTAADGADHDIRNHRRLAAGLAGQRLEVRDVTGSATKLSGVAMLTSVGAWRRAGGFGSGFYVDNLYHQAIREAGMKVGIMKTVYVYHWYRGDGDLGHLPKDRDGKPMLNRWGL